MAKGNKTGGRVKGTPNKLTKELRSSLKNILNSELELLEENMSQLDPKERIEILIKMMPYVFPKLENVSYSIHEPTDFDFF